ncbi:Lactose permease [compost metagenome]
MGAFKYITGVFDTRLSATIYLIGFNFAKQSAAIFLSAFAGNMYDRIGFQDTYLMLGCFVLAVTVISAFTLSSRQEIAAARAAA